jgi:hypothetical protein
MTALVTLAAEERVALEQPACTSVRESTGSGTIAGA